MFSTLSKTGIRKPDRTESIQNLPIPNFPPHDDDSISTLHPLDRTTLTTATHTQSSQSRGRPTQPTYSTNSASSVTSQSTAISVQSFLNLELKVAGLASQILVQQNKHAHQFDSIMSALNAILINQSSTQANSPGTSSQVAESNTHKSNTSGQEL